MADLTRCVFVPYVGVGDQVTVGQFYCLPLLYGYEYISYDEFHAKMADYGYGWNNLTASEQKVAYYLFDLILHVENDTIDQMVLQRNDETTRDRAEVQSLIDTAAELGRLIAEASLMAEQYTDNKVAGFTSYIDGHVSNLAQVDANLQWQIDNINTGIDAKIQGAYDYTDQVASQIYTYVDNSLTYAYNYTDQVAGQIYSYIDGQIGNLRTYIDAQLLGLDSYIDTQIGSLRSYVDTQLLGLTSYIDTQIGSIQTYVDGQISALTTYIDTGLSNAQTYVDEQVSALTTYIDTELSNAIIDINTTISTLETNLNTAIANLETKVTTDIETAKQFAIDQAKLYSDSLIADLQDNVIDPLLTHIEDIDSDITDIIKTLGDPALLFAWVTNTSVQKWNEIRPLFQMIAIEALKEV